MTSKGPFQPKAFYYSKLFYGSRPVKNGGLAFFILNFQAELKKSWSHQRIMCGFCAPVINLQQGRAWDVLHPINIFLIARSVGSQGRRENVVVAFSQP